MNDLFGSETTSTSSTNPFSGKQKQWYEELQPYLYNRMTNQRSYSGDLSAGLNSTQQSAIGKLSDYANNPMLSKYASGQMIDPTNNPYVQAQAGIIKQNASDTWQKQGDQVNSMFNKNSFWSGSAHENALKNAGADINKQTSSALASLYGDAYNTGVNQMLQAQSAQETAANNMLNAGNTQYNAEDTALTRKYAAWLKEQGLNDTDIERYLQYLGLGKNPTTSSSSSSIDNGEVTGTLLGLFL